MVEKKAFLSSTVTLIDRPEQNLFRVNVVGFYTIVRREIRRVARIWIQTIVPPAITMTLYFVIFGSLIGERIGNMDGVPYMSFIAPGLIMMAVITNSFGNVVSSFFSGKLHRHIGGVVRGLCVAALVTFVSLIFTELNVVHPFIALSVVVLTSMVFSLAGLLNAIFAKNFDDISIIPTFVLTPLTYLGGVFFSITLLSDTWQAVARLNPILYMVNAFRYGMLGSSDIPIATAYAIICISLVILYTTVLVLLNRGTGIRT